MATREPTPFERVFPLGELFRGRLLRAGLCFTLASLLLALLFVDLYLLLGLTTHSGTLRISAAERVELEQLLAPESTGDTTEAATTPAAIGTAAGEVLDNRGLLPEVWRHRHRPWGPGFAALYRDTPVLQTDPQALFALIALGALLSLPLILLESRARHLLRAETQELSTKLRTAIHRQSLRLGPSDLTGADGEHAFQLFTREVDQLRDAVYRYAQILTRDMVRFFVLLLIPIAVHPALALICLFPLAGVWFLTHQMRQRAEEAQRLSEALSERELRLLAESLSKAGLVRGYAMEALEQTQFQNSLQRYQATVAAAQRAQGRAGLVVRLLLLAGLTVVVFFMTAYALLPPREVSLPAALLMSVAIGYVWLPLRNLSNLESIRGDGNLTATRIHSYVNRIPEVGQAVGAKFLQPLARLIEFQQVSYSTASKQLLLDKLTLKLPAGRQHAIVATDPREGLALAYLLPRFIEPQSGRIQFDGEDISWVTLESLRAEALYVGGKDPYLTGTVRENLSGGSDNYALQEITEAAKLTHAHQFILKLPQGYETVIGEHGEPLDVGQSFRLALARALLRKPALLIIDEPTATLDDDTKTLLDDAYARIAQKRTVIFLPGRMSTLRRVDSIVLLHKGRVVAHGTHAELVEASPLYRHWEYMRFNEFRHEFEAE